TFQQLLHLRSAEAGSGRGFLKKVAVIGRLASVKVHCVLLNPLVIGDREGQGEKREIPPGSPETRQTAPLPASHNRSKLECSQLRGCRAGRYANEWGGRWDP